MRMNYTYKNTKVSAPWTVYIRGRRKPFIFHVGHYSVDVSDKEFKSLQEHIHIKRAIESKFLTFHSKQGENGKVETKDLVDVLEITEMNVDEAADEIEQIYDPDVLKAIGEKEVKGKDRKTIKEAIEDQLKRIEKGS